MGFKASMIIIHRPSMQLPEEVLLEHLDFNDLVFRETTTLDSCLYPGDKTVNIGYFNDNIVICDDYLLTTSLETTKPTCAWRRSDSLPCNSIGNRIRSRAVAGWFVGRVRAAGVDNVV